MTEEEAFIIASRTRKEDACGGGREEGQQTQPE